MNEHFVLHALMRGLEAEGATITQNRVEDEFAELNYTMNGQSFYVYLDVKQPEVAPSFDLQAMYENELVFDLDTYIADSIAEETIETDIMFHKAIGIDTWIFEAQGLPLGDSGNYLLHEDWCCPRKDYKPYSVQEYMEVFDELAKKYGK